MKDLIDVAPDGTVEQVAAAVEDRHPSTANIMRYFAYSHLGSEDLQAVSKPCLIIALGMIRVLPDSPELIAGLRHLLEAKDCFVRAALDA